MNGEIDDIVIGPDSEGRREDVIPAVGVLSPSSFTCPVFFSISFTRLILPPFGSLSHNLSQSALRNDSFKGQNSFDCSP